MCSSRFGIYFQIKYCLFKKKKNKNEEQVSRSENRNNKSKKEVIRAKTKKEVK